MRTPHANTACGRMQDAGRRKHQHQHQHQHPVGRTHTCTYHSTYCVRTPQTGQNMHLHHPTRFCARRLEGACGLVCGPRTGQGTGQGRKGGWVVDSVISLLNDAEDWRGASAAPCIPSPRIPSLRSGRRGRLPTCDCTGGAYRRTALRTKMLVWTAGGGVNWGSGSVR